jgi:hypothetical protein
MKMLNKASIPVGELQIEIQEKQEMENVKKFYEALAKDEAMKSRANALNAKYKGKKPSAAEVLAETAAFAKTEGYEFTADELKAYLSELSDESLENVAGGRAGGGETGFGTAEFGGCGCVCAGFVQDCSCMGAGFGTGSGGGEARVLFRIPLH